MIQLDELNSGKIRHAFYSRRGGVSQGIYRSLNCGFGSGDQRKSVAANRARTMAALDCDPDMLFTCNQVHSADVHVIDSDERPDEPPRADGMVTARKNVALGVLTADCAPVLFADPGDMIIGACHAGWRGALNGVIEATVEAMIELGARADNIQAAVGPCIGRDSYEVGPEFPHPFLEQDRNNAAFFSSGTREGHYQFDLSNYCVSRLSRLGLGEVYRLDCDTCRDEPNFFSYRRSRLRDERDYGRQLSTIVISE
ncbi:peptidoglycan editing factor PgeF [Nisaea acidiphila]|uniref:Purine nucleoside phosphorylase n=1 Tax=Nisaea acidiphila TaxID=1862145 RepID=A0A9J7AVB1_9PROT|nr:peptidoglycan editing factor PgeF [Nisaea acidiphila]UUX51264.1 peptidoglycan editing factor PgeF [Nisaea acidiphila]